MEYEQNPIPLKEHPYRSMFNTFSCSVQDCSEEHQVILESSINIHPHSGDAYGDYTIRCTKCGRQDSYSFADN